MIKPVETRNDLPTALLRALGDPIRLRILRLLEREELSVGELSRTLALAQSRVSNHLRVLREHDLLAERHAGTSTFLRLGLESATGGTGNLAARLWGALSADLGEHHADLERLRQVVAERREVDPEFFDRVAGRWDTIGIEFASGQARQRAVASLMPAGQVWGDLGCGTGYVARAMLGLCARIVCVDSSAGMLAEARARLAEHPGETEVDLRLGDLDALPIGEGELDGAVAAMVLHHLPDAAGCLAEVFRVLRPGGTAVVVELDPHREAWLSAELGDRHLGIDAQAVAAAFSAAGFEAVRMEALDDRYRPAPPPGQEALPGGGLPLYTLRGRKPLD
ncbi:MAG: ArsR family transcriptional regulator [Planctomycetes bacterium]|jgi:ArsR family transcriptional regulator|nr:ArsR family transcriptional regulator [Planctomycetota bacterium]MDP6407744.1 metalloregulator ArsR/SmtB family transcription factor [Planctomycetota bacterium]